MLHTPAYRKVRRKPGQIARCSVREKETGKGSTGKHGRNGFLRYSFTPLMEKQEALQNRKAIEQSFFSSLTNLASLYEFNPPDVSDKVYPYNIYLAYEKTKQVLSVIRPEFKTIIVTDETRASCLCTAKVYDTSTTLFYIPVCALYNLMRDQKHRRKTELLLSVFSYLYNTVKIPYYRNNSSFLYYNYETIEQWIIDEPGEWHENEYKGIIAELNCLKHGGNFIERKIKTKFHIRQFEKRISSFIPADDTEAELLQVCNEAFLIFKDYPSRTIFENIRPGLIDSEEDERVCPEQYISFIWKDSGWIYDQLLECVNTSFQECKAIDEPLTVQYFDTSQSAET